MVDGPEHLKFHLWLCSDNRALWFGKGGKLVGDTKLYHVTVTQLSIGRP